MLLTRSRKRRIVVTVPTFTMALEQHAVRLGLTMTELPFNRSPDLIHAVVTRAAIKDAGVVWLLTALVDTIDKNVGGDVGRWKHRSS